MTAESEDLRALYRHRFAHRRSPAIRPVAGALCEDFFQRWVPRESTVLDIAAGHCEFVNNIKAARRLAVDLNPDVARPRGAGRRGRRLPLRRADARSPTSPSTACSSATSSSTCRARSSCRTLTEARRVLRPDGKLLVLQPNVRYCARDYWMFFDHITPVDDRALAEAFAATGFDVELNIPRFLPYTTKSRVPSTPALVRLYLRSPLAWRLPGCAGVHGRGAGPPYVTDALRSRVHQGTRAVLANWPLAVLVYAVLFVIPAFDPTYPASGVDPSWHTALNEALARHLVFGRDIVFTYEPYASANTREYHPELPWLGIGGGLLLALGYVVAILVLLAGRHRWTSLGLALALLAGLASFDALALAYPLVLVLAIHRLLIESGNAPWDARDRVRLVLLLVPVGLLPLVKLSSTPTVLAARRGRVRAARACTGAGSRPSCAGWCRR